MVLSGAASYDLYFEHFRLAAEILSPSNTRAEIAVKLRGYRKGPDNLYVVVIDSRELLVEIYARSRDWEQRTLKKAGDPIEMPEFGLSCRVRDLYRGTPLNPERGQS